MFLPVRRLAALVTTLDLYGHLYPGDLDKYADRLDNAASEAMGKGKDEIRPDDEEDDPDES